MNPELRKSQIILARIKNQLVNAMPGLHWVVDQKMKVHSATPSDYQQIFNINSVQLAALHYLFSWYSSFVDEYDKHFTSTDPVDRDILEQIHMQTAQHFQLVSDKFPDLRQARNRVLAHGYRDHDKRPLSNDEINALYDGLIQHEQLEIFHLLPIAATRVITVIEKYFEPITETELNLSPVIFDDTE